MFDILNNGETYFRDKAGAFEPAIIDQFIFANISGVDSNTVIDKNQSLPSPGDIVDTVNITRTAKVNDDKVVYSTILDVTVGDYDFNWIGLYASATNTLIAVGTLDTVQKRQELVGVQTGNNITRSYVIQFTNAASVTGITIAAASWQLDFTSYLTNADTRNRELAFDTFGVAFIEDNGFSLEKNTPSNYQINPGHGIFKGYRYELTALENFLLPPLVAPFKVWIDLSLEGDVNGKSVEASFVYDQSSQPDYTVDGVDHFLVEIGGVDASGDVYDSLGPYRNPFSLWDAIQQKMETRLSRSNEAGFVLHERAEKYIDYQIDNSTGSTQDHSLIFQDSPSISVQDIDSLTVSFDIEILSGTLTGDVRAFIDVDAEDIVFVGADIRKGDAIVFDGERVSHTFDVSSVNDYFIKPGIYFTGITDVSDFTFRIRNVQASGDDGAIEFTPKYNLLDNISMLGADVSQLPNLWVSGQAAIGDVVIAGQLEIPSRYWDEPFSSLEELEGDAILIHGHTTNKLEVTLNNSTGSDRKSVV